MAGTRKSHFLSRFYLGGFTRSGRKEDRFWVHSKKQERHWPMRAEEAGHQRDLFRLEGPEDRADELEDGFGSVEGRIAPVLREVLKTKRLPSDPESFSLLLHLPALNAARPPAEINAVADFNDKMLRGMIVDDLTPELHQKILDDWKAQGRDVTHISDLEAVKQRITEKGHVRAVLNKNALLTQVTGRSALLVELFHVRSWALLETTQEVGYFVGSDRPVYLVNNQELEPDVQPRFDDSRFDVVMPLSKELCLVGHMHGRDGSGIARRESVSCINFMTAASATDYIYSPMQAYLVADAAQIDADLSEIYRADILAASSRPGLWRR